MNDLIDRQAAIDAYGDWYVEEGTAEGFIGTVKQLLEGLPSAQPETHEKRTETHACDCVSRQAAIDALDTIESEVADGEGFRYAKWREYFENLPSAQPEQIRTQMSLANCISRRDAIDAVNAYLGLSAVSRTIQNMTSIQGILEKLPSAQPKIIHCKDCKWKQGAECVRFAEIRPFPDDFCSRGERRAYG